MAYTILNTDGTTLLLLADGRVDESSTSLSLIGKNVPSYGEYINNNFVRLLGNFANTAGSPPRTPILGQLWYDSSAQRLKIYDDGFKAVGGAIVSAEDPGTLTTGDLWWDSSNKQLKAYANNELTIVGPTFPSFVGDNGFHLPTNPVYDDSTPSVAQNVTIISNYGEFRGMLSNEEFVLSSNDSILYFSTTTSTTIVAGLTVAGDIKYTGKILQKHLSANFSLEQIILSDPDPRKYDEYNLQNSTVTTILSAMYPILANTTTNEMGLPEGTEARVTLTFEAGTGGTQVRRYVVRKQIGFTTLSWQPYEVYSYLFADDGFGSPITTASNVMLDLRT